MNSQGLMREVKVWDLPVRLFHWALAGLVAALWASGELGKLDIHMKLGLAALSLVVFRLMWGVAGSRTARFSSFVKGPGQALAHLRTPKDHSIGHNPLGAFSVLALLLMVSIQAGSGLFTSDDIFTEGPLTHLVSSSTGSILSTVHRAGFNVLLALIGLHLAAIAFYRFVKRDNLVLPMITGRKLMPATAEDNGGGNPWLALVLAAAATALVWGGIALLSA